MPSEGCLNSDNPLNILFQKGVSHLIGLLSHLLILGITVISLRIFILFASCRGRILQVVGRTAVLSLICC